MIKWYGLPKSKKARGKQKARRWIASVKGVSKEHEKLYKNMEWSKPKVAQRKT